MDVDIESFNVEGLEKVSIVDHTFYIYGEYLVSINHSKHETELLVRRMEYLKKWNSNQIMMLEKIALKDKQYYHLYRNPFTVLDNISILSSEHNINDYCYDLLLSLCHLYILDVGNLIIVVGSKVPIIICISGSSIKTPEYDLYNRVSYFYLPKGITDYLRISSILNSKSRYVSNTLINLDDDIRIYNTPIKKSIHDNEVYYNVNQIHIERFDTCMRLLTNVIDVYDKDIIISGDKSITKSGLNYKDLDSALRVSIRRGNIIKSIIIMSEIYNLSIYEYNIMKILLNTITNIALFDIGIANINLVINIIKQINDFRIHYPTIRILSGIVKRLAKSKKSRYYLWISRTYQQDEHIIEYNLYINKDMSNYKDVRIFKPFNKVTSRLLFLLKKNLNIAHYSSLYWLESIFKDFDRKAKDLRYNYYNINNIGSYILYILRETDLYKDRDNIFMTLLNSYKGTYNRDILRFAVVLYLKYIDITYTEINFNDDIIGIERLLKREYIVDMDRVRYYYYYGINSEIPLEDEEFLEVGTFTKYDMEDIKLDDERDIGYSKGFYLRFCEYVVNDIPISQDDLIYKEIYEELFTTEIAGT